MWRNSSHPSIEPPAETDKVRLVSSCPCCGSDHYSQLVAISDVNRDRYRRFSDIKYGGLLDDWVTTLKPEIVVCSDCGHHWYLRQPSPEQLSLMYGNGRRLLPGAVSREPTQEMLAEMRRLAKLIGKEQPRLLDFGSGFGRWARAAARAGFLVHAYEPTKARGAEAVEEFTLVHELSEVAGMSFDAINFEQVLEHVPDPEETLRTITAFCTPKSVLRIRVPNILRPPEGNKVWVDWPYDGKRVHAMAPFEHLHGFTPDSLRCLLERSGFRFLTAQTLFGNYPATLIRQLIGRWVPRVAQTLALVNPAAG